MTFDLPERRLSHDLKLGRFLNWANLSFKIISHNSKEFIKLVSLKNEPNLLPLETVYYSSILDIWQDTYSFMIHIAQSYLRLKCDIIVEADIQDIQAYIDSVGTNVIDNDFYTFVYLLANPDKITLNYKLNAPKIYKKKGTYTSCH